MRSRWAIVILGTVLSTFGARAQENSIAQQCREQHANNREAQVQCVRQAHAASKPAQKVPVSSVLRAPLSQQQVIFGLYDRRFAGFNGGKEHLGVDFAAAAGTWVQAVCDGKVVSNNTSHADIVTSRLVIEHECPQPLGLVYGYYGHIMSERIEGESLVAGDTVGQVKDWAGNSHLHLGLSTQLVEENWGVLPPGATLRDIEAQGWINPLLYLNSSPRPARKAAPARKNTVQKKQRK